MLRDLPAGHDVYNTVFFIYRKKEREKRDKRRMAAQRPQSAAVEPGVARVRTTGKKKGLVSRHYTN